MVYDDSDPTHETGVKEEEEGEPKRRCGRKEGWELSTGTCT